MTQCDESKHNRHSDGKFANKPHAEADVSITSVLPPLPAALDTELALRDQQGLHIETEGEATYFTDWDAGTRIAGTYSADEDGSTAFYAEVDGKPVIDVRGVKGEEAATARAVREQYDGVVGWGADPAHQIPDPTIPPRLEELGFDLDGGTDEYLHIALEAERERLEEEAELLGLDTNFSTRDFDARSRAEVSKDLAQFLTENAEDVETLMVEHGRDSEWIAQSFFAERGGWGDWFREQGYGEVGERLSKAVKNYDAPAMLGDDGKLFFE